MLYADLAALREHRCILEEELRVTNRMRQALERQESANASMVPTSPFLAERKEFAEGQRQAILRRIHFLENAEEQLADLVRYSGSTLEDALRRL